MYKKESRSLYTYTQTKREHHDTPGKIPEVCTKLQLSPHLTASIANSLK